MISIRAILNKLFFSRYFLNVSIIWIWPLILFIFIVRKIAVIRFCPLTSGRLGDSITDFVEQDLQRNFRKSSSPFLFTFYYFETRVFPNVFWKHYMKRNLYVSGEWARQVDYWLKQFDCLSIHHLEPTQTYNRDIHGLITKTNYSLAFTAFEESHGRQWLFDHGWRENQKIVCFHIRDESFLAKNPINNPGSDLDVWGYHSFRNSDISSYMPAIHWLLERDYFVIRMGRIANNCVDIRHKSFLDLPFMPDVDDFFDIWLMARSFAAIGTYSGLDHAAIVNRVPMLFLNALPFAEIFSYSKMMWVPKTLKWKNNNEALSISEHFNKAWFNRTESYTNNGIEVHDLTSIEILAYTKEFFHWIERDFKISEADTKLMAEFWSFVSSWDSHFMLHDWIHPNAITSISWLKGNMTKGGL